MAELAAARRRLRNDSTQGMRLRPTVQGRPQYKFPSGHRTHSQRQSPSRRLSWGMISSLGHSERLARAIKQPNEVQTK